jgi:hypothetical protein
VGFHGSAWLFFRIFCVCIQATCAQIGRLTAVHAAELRW